MFLALSILLSKIPMKSGVKRFMRALGKHYGDSHEQGEIWVRQQTLAEEENISRATIWRNAQEALSLDLISVKKQYHSNGRQKCSTYQINWFKLYELADQKIYSDQLPIKDSLETELPEIDDILTYIERHDPETRDGLMERPMELINNVPYVAFCNTSKENKLYIKNISSNRSHFSQHKRVIKPDDIPIKRSEPQLVASYLQQMRHLIFRRL